mmetsp:Transcript_94742/g.210642  ORF Transcript_94742/g.210642 Transcript_94742/m.210642 type:complete len:287 (-) Transcript_94742:58-918(-)
MAMEWVYGFQMKRTSEEQIERKVQAEMARSVAHVRKLGQARKGDDSSGDCDDWDPSAEVAAAANRRVREHTSSRLVTADFGCHECLRVVKATSAIPEKVYVTVEHWHGWADPSRGPHKWEDVKLLCAACKAPELEEARKRTREYNTDRAREQSKRLKAHGESADAGDDGFMEKLCKLKVPQLSALCSANAVLKTGKKEQLMERLVGVRRFGSLSQCPSCKQGPLELQYWGGVSTPRAIKCKNMRGKGRPCGFSKKLVPDETRQVLTAPLRDTTDGDLARVGIFLEG